MGGDVGNEWIRADFEISSMRLGSGKATVPNGCRGRRSRLGLLA